MFETQTSGSPTDRQAPPAAGSTGLDAASVAAVKHDLASALSTPSGLDDAGRVDTIRALEELVCVATAAQATLTAELDTSVREAEEAAGVAAARRGRGVGAQVALARRESPHRGRGHLGLAKIIASELPHTWAAWRTGRITEWKAILVARETACLPLDLRREVDRLVASDHDRLESMGDRQLAGTCASHAARLDPAAVAARRRKAETERHVTLRPAPDTMTYLTALLPVKDGVAALAALTRAADSARAAGDPRTKGQVMADTLVDGVTTAPHPDQAAQTGGSEPDGAAAPRTDRGPRISLGLVMTDTALFGTSDDPAHVEGYGPVPAELAREIIAGSCTRDEEIWLRRLYTSPTTGELAALDARGRSFRNGLARFVRLRDQTCRTPWCDAPVRHVDHATDASRAGATSAANGQGLCESCNYAKQAPGWSARARPSCDAGDHEVETTTPTGHTHTTRPPPLVTIRAQAAPRLSIDYVLAG